MPNANKNIDEFQKFQFALDGVPAAVGYVDS